MNEFLQDYKLLLIYAAAVLASVVVLYFLTNLLHKWLVNKEHRKFPDVSARPVHLVRRVLNALWIVLGFMAISFIFAGEEQYDKLISDFKLIFYLGFLAVATIVGAASVNMWFRKTIQKKVVNKEDPTSFKFIGYVSVFGVYFFGVILGLLAFPAFKGVAQTALGGAGVIAIIAGIASQEALSNLVGGIFIISFKPFIIGDIIKITDNMVGTVTDITLRHTVIKNFENKMIVLPNSIINKERLINYDLGESKCCEHVEIDISYDSNVKLAKKLIQEECAKHPLIFDNRSEMDKKDGLPMVRVALIKMNDSSVTIRAWAWSENFTDSFQLKIDVLESTKERFEQEGIEIPFPYRTIVMKEMKKSDVDKSIKHD